MQPLMLIARIVDHLQARKLVAHGAQLDANVVKQGLIGELVTVKAWLTVCVPSVAT